jgi:hypothetical protein
MKVKSVDPAHSETPITKTFLDKLLYDLTCRFESFKDEMNQKISYLAIENEILKQEIFQLAKGMYEKEQPVAYKNLDPNSSFFLSNLFLQ